MFCSECGNALSDDAQFCPKCGARAMFGTSGDARTEFPSATRDRKPLIIGISLAFTLVLAIGAVSTYISWVGRRNDERLIDQAIDLSNRSEFDRSNRLLRPLAEKGVPRAQFDLGVSYANGQGVAKDDAQAIEWYSKAADQGFAPAQDALGYMYGTGEGVARDDTQAAAWWRKAAAQGNEDAQASLNELQTLLTASGSLADIGNNTSLVCDGLFSGNAMSSVRLAAALTLESTRTGGWEASFDAPRRDRAITMESEFVTTDGADYGHGEHTTAESKSDASKWEVIETHWQNQVRQYVRHFTLERSNGRVTYISDSGPDKRFLNTSYFGYCHKQTSEEKMAMVRDAKTAAEQDNPWLAIALHMPFRQRQMCDSMRSQLIRFAQVPHIRQQDWDGYFDKITIIASQAHCLPE